MKKVLATVLITVMAFGIASNALAKVKKNPPRTKKDAEAAVKEAGGEHFPERIRINKLGTMEVSDDNYYHLFCGTLKKGGFHVIIFDNKPQYLGFYQTEYEPVELEEKVVLLDSGETSEEGDTSYFRITIGKKGPAKKIRVDGVPISFVKNEKAVVDTAAKKAKAKKAEATADAASDETKPEYREWSVKMKGKRVKFRAIFIEFSPGNRVTLKEEKKGLTKDFPITTLSEGDREYLKQFK